MKTIIPGAALSAFVAILAIILSGLLPFEFIGATVIAIFIGILFRYFFPLNDHFKPGIRFSSKRILKAFIVLLGASMNLGIILEVGAQALLLLAFTLFTAFFFGSLFGKWLGTGSKLTSLLSAGTAICGGTAISAVAPVINARDEDVSYSISTVFLIDMFLIILFPLAGEFFGFSNIIMGFWSGTAINDTSSVIAASFAFSTAAGEIATMVKLTRTLAIVPVVLIFGYKTTRDKSKNPVGDAEVRDIFPWFILLFITLAAVNTLGWIPVQVGGFLNSLRSFLMVMALASIGLNTNIRSIKQLGIKPFIHSLLLSFLVISVSIMVTVFLIV